jgi:3-deoxy-7-phosphoheptulonate synthase
MPTSTPNPANAPDPTQQPGIEHTPDWSPSTWRTRPQAQAITYADTARLASVEARLATLPPLVTSWEIESLKAKLADAAAGKRFVLQGGDCAEALADCRPEPLASKLKILLQMSLVLIHASKKPVVRIGRFAGQYAKPRTSATETRIVAGVATTLPSYFGDLINRPSFDAASRAPDPSLLLEAYQHSALTLNFIRSLVDGGFADLHHPEYWDLSFMRHASLSPAVRSEYERMTRNLADGLRFMEALGERTVEDLARAEFFTSHEGLNLNYEAAQTRRVPRRPGFYDLTTHLPWIGERTRQLDGAHIEFFRGIENPVGVKVGPKATPSDVVALVRALNPRNEAGKLVLISRMGAAQVATALPPLIEAVAREGLRAGWICDPMHGNASTAANGLKTRSFDAILSELEQTFDIHLRVGVPMAGVHFELTGEDVTECVGGSTGLSEADLSTNYATACDPRLNYQQSLEMAFLLARRMHF